METRLYFRIITHLSILYQNAEVSNIPFRGGHCIVFGKSAEGLEEDLLGATRVNRTFPLSVPGAQATCDPVTGISVVFTSFYVKKYSLDLVEVQL